MSSTEPRAAAVGDARTAAAGGPPAAPTADAPARSARVDTVYRPRHPLDFWTTVGMIRRGRADPAHLHDRGVFWRASRTPHGIATLATAPSGDGSINASAWGPGAEWAIAQLPALLGSLDDPTPFEAHHHPLIAATHRRNPGLRLTRTDLVFDALAASIIEQKVTGLQAFGAWRVLMTRFGTRAPGPAPRALFAPPSVAEWGAIPSWAWHRAGVEPPQSRTIVQTARVGQRLAEATATAADGPARDRVLTSVRGVGVWTSAETRIRALGDADAVSFADFHLASQVGYALTGSRVDDDGMRELLEPWVGQRQRVIRLIGLSGVHEPRRGPRLHPEDHRGR